MQAFDFLDNHVHKITDTYIGLQLAGWEIVIEAYLNRVLKLSTARPDQNVRHHAAESRRKPTFYRARPDCRSLDLYRLLLFCS